MPALAVEIRPRIPLSCVLFIMVDRARAVGREAGLTDLIADAFCRAVERATRRGLLSGYRRVEEAARAPRGRLLFAEQLRRRPGLSPPIEIGHDLHTPDVDENRLLLAALHALRACPLRSPRLRRELARAGSLFGGVALVAFDGRALPDPPVTRLNRHYEPALRLARLVLASTALRLGIGKVRADAFLVDMNAVFEAFFREALRAALGATRGSFPDRGPPLRLDRHGRIALRPDLCLVAGGRVLWLGDAKYKRLAGAGGHVNADVYQMLAYLVATGLGSGTLIYAAGEGVEPADHHVDEVGRVVRVRALDLSRPPQGILDQVKQIAAQVRRE